MEQARQLQQTLVRERPKQPEYRKGLASIDQNLRQLRSGSRLQLLALPAVQKELKLSEDEVRQVTELAERRREAWRDARNLSEDERQAKLEKQADQERALIRQLEPEQQRRLRQIELQQLGALAFGRPSVIAALQLTDPQLEQIRAIQGDPHRPRGGPRPGGRHPGVGKRAEDFRNTALEQALTVLTAEQREEWKRLVGEPFKLERPGPALDYGFRPARNPRKP